MLHGPTGCLSQPQITGRSRQAVSPQTSSRPRPPPRLARSWPAPARRGPRSLSGRRPSGHTWWSYFGSYGDHPVW